MLLALWIVLALAAYALAAPRIGPAEDAAILYLYSENLADTGVISYSAGGPPAEGATDFLWMVLLAGLYRLGLDTHLAATLLSGIAHLATAWLVMRLAGGRDRRVFFCAAFGLFLMPAFFAALLGFSALLFGFFVLLDALWFVEGRPTALACSALLTCLVRPDGVAFVVPLLVAFLLIRRDGRAAALKRFLLLFVLPGLAYFVWRLLYFERWLPLPFYVKSGSGERLGPFQRDTLLLNLRTLALLAPAIAVALWRIGTRPVAERARIVALLVALILIPLGIYSTFHLVQNTGQRFQYPMVLAGLALPAVRRDERPARRAHLVSAGAGVLGTLPAWLLLALYVLRMPLLNLPSIARDLGGAACRGTMAVSEAGCLPYHSRWTCTDLWGLNTPELARRAVAVADLERLAPDLVVVNASPQIYTRIVQGAEPPEASEHTWHAMAQNTCLYAVREGLELLLVPAARREAGRWHSALQRLAARWGLDESDHYLMFFLAPHSDCREELRRILVAHGGISVEQRRRDLRARARAAEEVR